MSFALPAVTSCIFCTLQCHFYPESLSFFTAADPKLGRPLSCLAWSRWSDVIRMRCKSAGKN